MSLCEHPNCIRAAVVVVVRTQMIRRSDGTWFQAAVPNRFDLCQRHGSELQSICDVGAGA